MQIYGKERTSANGGAPREEYPTIIVIIEKRSPVAWAGLEVTMQPRMTKLQPLWLEVSTPFLKKYIRCIYFIYSECFLCFSVYHMHAVSAEVRRGYQVFTE